jgi:hypothetical protein
MSMGSLSMGNKWGEFWVEGSWVWGMGGSRWRGRGMKQCLIPRRSLPPCFEWDNGSSFSSILNQWSVEECPVWIFYYSNWQNVAREQIKCYNMHKGYVYWISNGGKYIKGRIFCKTACFVLIAKGKKCSSKEIRSLAMVGRRGGGGDGNIILWRVV